MSEGFGVVPDAKHARTIMSKELRAEARAAITKLECGELLPLPEAAAVWVYDLKRAVMRRERAQINNSRLY